MNFAILQDHRVKIKEILNRDLARELKKFMEHEGESDTNCNWCTWNSFIRKVEELETRGRAKMIQITTLLRSARILRKVPETYCHFGSGERPSASTGVKSCKEYNNNLLSSGFCPSSRPPSKNKRKKIEKYFDFVRELKATLRYEDDGDMNCNLNVWNSPQGIEKGIETSGNQRNN